jgi:hypothetical protein
MATTEVAATLDLTPVPIDICLSRGNDRPFSFRFLESDGTTLRDMSGFTTITLTVSSVKAPSGATPAPEFALIGVVSGGSSEIVTFTPTALQMDLSPKKWFFDIQVEDPIFTEVKGIFLIEQDITK